MVIEPGLKLWGSERAFLATVPALCDAWERVVVMLPPDAELVRELAGHGVDVIESPIGLLHRGGMRARLGAAVAIARACVRHRIDAIYLNQAGMCRIVHAVARLLGLPTIVHVRIAEDIARCRALRATQRAPVSLVMISRSMQERYGESGASEPFKTMVLAYDPFEMPQGAVTAVPDRELACVGRLAGIKGQMELVEAIGMIDRQRRPRLHLIGASAAGDDYGERLERKCAEIGLGEHVELLGYRTDASQLMERYRFVVVPSRYEPLGRVIFEAWSAGALPISLANNGGAAEVIEASGGGLICQGASSADIAAAIVTATSMPEEERLVLVERGRAWARRNLSVAAYRQALDGVLFATVKGSI